MIVVADNFANIIKNALILDTCDVSYTYQVKDAYTHIIKDVQSAPVQNSAACVCAIGMFDGFHIGHQQLFHKASTYAQKRAHRFVAITFFPDPTAVVSSSVQAQLLDCKSRIRACFAHGADEVVVFNFTAEFAKKTYQSFFEEYLFPNFSISDIFVGTNFALGAHAKGTVDVLEAYLHTRAIVLHAQELMCASGKPVSSTRIRNDLSAGDIVSATQLLGRNHFVTGRVIPGRAQGRQFGFPTANIACTPDSTLPKEGVYAGLVCIQEKEYLSCWPSAINVGFPQSFKTQNFSTEKFCEANLRGFNSDIYDKEVYVVFTHFLRNARKFSSIEKLKEQLNMDIFWVDTHMAQQGIKVGLHGE